MMKKLNLFSVIIILFTLVFFNACKYSEQPKVFENDKVYIEYPSYLGKSKHVFPVENLLLGLKNDYRDVFFILVDYGQKPGENGFTVMYDSLTNQLKNGIREAFLEKDSSFTHNGFKVRQMHLSGIIAATEQEKKNVFYFQFI